MKRDRRDGGIAARRAIVHWAGRLFRKEWRQHVLILTLLTVTVTVAVAGICAASKLAPASIEGELGTARAAFDFVDPSPRTLDHARDWFGQVDAIGHHEIVVPGTTASFDVRAQDPNGAFGGPMLRLRTGRYPTGAHELAATPWVMTTFDVNIGDTLSLDRETWAVVGSVENPSDLGDHFALVPYGDIESSDSITLLVDADRELIDSYRPVGNSDLMVTTRSDIPEDLVAALLMLIATTLVLFLVALVAAASFAVIAQRRLPQLGMLAAVGGTERQVRMTMLADGAVTGVVGGLLGAITGLGAWVGLAPSMETVVGSRIERLDVPWWLVLVVVLLSVATSTFAAWWPGRTMSRLPPIVALSGRTPRPASIDRSLALALGCAAAGAVALRYGSGTTDGSATLLEIVAIVGGTLALAAGVLLISPLVVRAAGRLGRRSPVSARLALRDLSRHQARSAAALAAISLALGIPVAVVATAAAADNNQGPGNLSATQFLLRPAEVDGPFIVDPAVVPDLQIGADAIAEALGSTPLRLDVAVDPNSATDARFGRPAVTVDRAIDDGWQFVSSVYVADDWLLAMYGLSLDELPSGSDVLTVDDGELVLTGSFNGLAERSTSQPLSETGTLPRTYDALPGALVTPADAAARGWEVQPSGRWLVQTDHAPTDQELRHARTVAAASGMAIEARHVGGGLEGLRLGAVVVGMLLALAVLAMTIGLIRSESAGDLRALTAAGATSRTRRNLTAVTAGALALFGALIGATGAYLGLAVGRLAHLTPLPLSDLALIIVGTPFVAAGVAWLGAGREPPALARAPIS